MNTENVFNNLSTYFAKWTHLNEFLIIFACELTEIYLSLTFVEIFEKRIKLLEHELKELKSTVIERFDKMEVLITELFSNSTIITEHCSEPNLSQASGPVAKTSVIDELITLPQPIASSSFLQVSEKEMDIDEDDEDGIFYTTVPTHGYVSDIFLR